MQQGRHEKKDSHETPKDKIIRLFIAMLKT